jgi:hypothetical protein
MERRKSARLVKLRSDKRSPSPIFKVLLKKRRPTPQKTPKQIAQKENTRVSLVRQRSKTSLSLVKKRSKPSLSTVKQKSKRETPNKTDREKKIDKFRKESRQHSGAFYDTILEKYNLIGKSPLARGAFADVYVLPNHHLLRLEMGGITFVRIGEAKRATLQALQAHHCPMLAQLFNVTLYTERVGQTSPWVLVSEMEHLQELPWSTWRTIYATEKEVASAIFEAVAGLIKLNIFHADVNDNNVMLTAKGVRFIDFDNACSDVDGAQKNCSEIVTGTTGFVAPEFLVLLKKTHHFTALPLAQQQHMYRQNFIYAAGALVYMIITKRDPPKAPIPYKDLPASVSTWVRDATHPESTQRHLP